MLRAPFSAYEKIVFHSLVISKKSANAHIDEACDRLKLIKIFSRRKTIIRQP